MSNALYNFEILRLAASTGDFRRLTNPQGSAEKRSPVCGSRVTIDIDLDEHDCVADIGQEVRACAMGQASSAMLNAAILGKSGPDLEEACAMLRAFLSGEAQSPGDWPGLQLFAPALPHRGRHAAILLPFEAAAEAVTRAKSRSLA
jgi:NifU-like protein involved in Fe-S cluster formation